MKPISAALMLVIAATLLFGQVDEAREAIERGEYVRAVNILSEALASQPTADTYLYLGIAYGHMKEYSKAEDTLNEGSNRYPRIPVFITSSPACISQTTTSTLRSWNCASRSARIQTTTMLRICWQRSICQG